MRTIARLLRPCRAFHAWLALALCALPAVARAEQGDVTGTFTLGAGALTYNFAEGGHAASLTTLAKTLPFSEFVGAGYFVTDKLRVGMNLQFTEALTVPTPPPPSRFTTFALLPQVSYLFARPFFASLVAFLPLRFGGVDQFGYGVQGVIGAGLPVGKDLSLTAALEVPLIFAPVLSLGLTPLVGLAYRL